MRMRRWTQRTENVHFECCQKTKATGSACSKERKVATYLRNVHIALDFSTPVPQDIREKVLERSSNVIHDEIGSIPQTISREWCVTPEWIVNRQDVPIIIIAVPTDVLSSSLETHIFNRRAAGDSLIVP